MPKLVGMFFDLEPDVASWINREHKRTGIPKRIIVQNAIKMAMTSQRMLKFARKNTPK